MARGRLGPAFGSSTFTPQPSCPPITFSWCQPALCLPLPKPPVTASGAHPGNPGGPLQGPCCGLNVCVPHPRAEALSPNGMVSAVGLWEAIRVGGGEGGARNGTGALLRGGGGQSLLCLVRTRRGGSNLTVDDHLHWEPTLAINHICRTRSPEIQELQ